MNRCRRCNREISDPNAVFGWRCAEILGVSETLSGMGQDTFNKFIDGVTKAHRLFGNGNLTDEQYKRIYSAFAKQSIWKGVDEKKVKEAKKESYPLISKDKSKISSLNDDLKEYKSYLDTASNVLTTASLIPGLDIITNLVSIPVDLARGDYVSAGLSTLGILPVVGEAADTAKIVRTGDKIADTAKTVKTADKLKDTAKITQKTSKALLTSAVKKGFTEGIATGTIYAASGKRFDTGFVNGFAEGFVAETGERIGGTPGKIIGDTIGSAVGSLAEDSFYNKDKSPDDIAKSAAESAAWGLAGGLSGTYIDEAIKMADKAGSEAKTLMKYDERFGKALKVFFEQLVNILSSQ